MWPAAGGDDERVGIVKLRFSKAELAAAAAEFTRDEDDDHLFGGGFSGSDGEEPPLPATADHDGFDFDRAFEDEDELPSPPQFREPEPAQELIDHAVWAKLRGFPAWPAQVLSAFAGHQAPPPPRPGQSVLVHFFGTYDIQWLESDKKVSPFHDNFEQYSTACKQKPFLKAVAEAQHFVATGGAAGGELPAGMTGLYEGKSIADLVLRPKSAKATKGSRGGVAKAGNGVTKRGGGGGVSRRVRVARYLGLLPPAGGGLQPLPILPPA